MYNSKRILITGATGFVGDFLVSALQVRWPGAEIYGTSQSKYPENKEGITILQLDITDRQSVMRVIEAIRPAVIVHLAAQTHIPVSFDDPFETWEVNLEGTRHLLDASVSYVPDVVMVNVGSADMYGSSFSNGSAVSESAVLQPLNPYAASKCAADLLSFQVSQTTGLKVLRLRPFNHTGPGQGAAFVLPSFARQIAMIEAGRQAAVIKVGNINVQRDIMDVRDMVDAYVGLLELSPKMSAGELFNIATGKALKISTLLRYMIDQSCSDIVIEIDPLLIRGTDIDVVTCDTSKLRRHLVNWHPKISAQQTVCDVMDDWRRRVTCTA